MIAFIDLETGSHKDKSGDIIKDGNVMQIGCVVTDGNYREIGRFESKCMPHSEPSKEALEFNKLDNWQDFPLASDVARKFLDFLESFKTELVFAAHNVAFDYPQFREFFARHGMITRFNQYVLPYGHYCTLKSSRFLYKNGLIKVGRHNLSHLCMYFGIPLHNHHEAINDCLATIELAKKLSVYENKLINKEYELSTNIMNDSKYFIGNEEGVYITQHALRNPKVMQAILKNLFLRYQKGMTPWVLGKTLSKRILNSNYKSLSKTKDTTKKQESFL